MSRLLITNSFFKNNELFGIFYCFEHSLNLVLEPIIDCFEHILVFSTIKIHELKIIPIITTLTLHACAWKGRK